jgi:hypothetical protein
MRPDIESARQRLQTVLGELEQCCADEETFSPQRVQEAHPLVQLLHEEGFEIATRMESNNIVVEVEPMSMESLAA